MRKIQSAREAQRGQLLSLENYYFGLQKVDLIRSAWKRSVLIVQPLQFHDRLWFPSTCLRSDLHFRIVGSQFVCNFVGG